MRVEELSMTIDELRKGRLVLDDEIVKKAKEELVSRLEDTRKALDSDNRFFTRHYLDQCSLSLSYLEGLLELLETEEANI